MVTPTLFQSRPDFQSNQLREWAEAVALIVAAAASAALIWQGWPWLALAVGLITAPLVSWRCVRTNARLRAALAEADKQQAVLEQALRQAQNMAALGRMTAGVAHDFNNHLTVISSNVEMVASRLDPAQDRLLRYTDAAMKGVQRAAILTGRLLSLSRQPAAEPEAVDVDHLVGSLSDLLHRTLSDRLKLDVCLSGTPWLVWADINRMETALMSLTVSTPEPAAVEGTLKITVSNVKLDAAFADAHPPVKAGEYIQIAVTRPAGGQSLTGADLFMVRTFVREAGGCLIQPSPDFHGVPVRGMPVGSMPVGSMPVGSMPVGGIPVRGVSVRLFLPRYLPPAMSSIRQAPDQLTILMVEDDAELRTACVETLRGSGYNVLEASDAMEAFQVITDRGGIDLLFTDLGLPGGVSGCALADAARHVDAGMRVLFTTGYDRTDLPHRAAAALLRKPFNPGELIARVRDILAAAQPAQQSETVRG